MSLKLAGITKAFKKEIVLQDVSLDVETGKTLVLFGPSGAGKTVLLRLIAGVIEPDAGTIQIAGRDMEGVEPEDRDVGMAFQNFALFPHMSAEDNIASPLTAQRQSQSEIKSGIQALAKLLKIEHVLGHKPKELSNGQKQRTALARALAGKPGSLLLDDPLRNVDAKLRFEMRLELPRLLKDQNATVIYVTQDYKEAMAFGDQIAVIHEGQVQQIGTPEEIYLTPATTEIARLFGDPVINLMDVAPEARGRMVSVSVSDQPIMLDPGYAEMVGQECVLGVRPEAFRFVEPNSPSAIPVQVETEAPLNEKTVTLVLTAGGREVMVTRPSGTPGPNGGTAHITIDSAATLLFDRASGRLCVPKATIAGEAIA
ncbi:MAG: ABC transporter ATP-binding protein [Litoreibacter sp.]|nr:ABC transporter ATP-binding protein [Litoreibacter sp.]